MALGKVQITKKGRTNVYTVPPSSRSTVNVLIHANLDSQTRIAVAPSLDLGYDAAPDEALIANIAAPKEETIQRYSSGAPIANGNFGSSVAISRDGIWSAIGMTGNSIAGSNAGAVEVYKLVDGVWTFTQILTPGLSNDRAGSSVALSADGNYLAVSEGNSTVLHIYFRNNTETFILQQSISVGNNANTTGAYNQILTITDDGSRLAIGNRTNSPSVGGEVNIFNRVGSIWTLFQTIANPQAATSDLFGESVSFSGDGNYLAIGEPSDDVTQINSGKAHIYFFNGTTYVSLQVFKAPTVEANSNFGVSVSVSGDGNYLAIGENLRDATIDGTATDAGQVYIYLRSGAVWNLQATLSNGKIDGVAGPAIASSNFGYRVLLNSTGDIMLVGEFLYDLLPSNNVGAYWIFFRNGTTWTGKRYTFPFGGGSQLGWSIALSDIDVSRAAFDGEYFDASAIRVLNLAVGAFSAAAVGATAAGAVIFTQNDANFSTYIDAVENEVTAQINEQDLNLTDKVLISSPGTYERTGLVLDAGESIVVVTENITDAVVHVRGFEETL